MAKFRWRRWRNESGDEWMVMNEWRGRREGGGSKVAAKEGSDFPCERRVARCCAFAHAAMHGPLLGIAVVLVPVG